MSSMRNPRPNRGNMYPPNIVSPMSYFNPAPPMSTGGGISNMATAGYDGITTAHSNAVRSPSVPSRVGSSSMPSIEDMHKDYVNNKVELTKHISTAAGAVEKLWGEDGWFIRWYETPTQSVVNNARVPIKGADISTSGKSRVDRSASKKVEAKKGKGGLVVLPHCTALRNDIHNLVEHVNIPPSVSSRAVEMILARVKDQKQRFSWVIGPEEQPVLETLLRNAQFWCEEVAPTLSANLNFRDNLFCDVKGQPAAASSSRIEGSDALLVQGSPTRTQDRDLSQREVLRGAQEMFTSRREASLMQVTNLPEPANKLSRPPTKFQLPFDPVLSATQAQGVGLQPSLHNGTKHTSDTLNAVSFETTVGSFEKLSVSEAYPNHADRIRTLPNGTILHLLNDKSEVEDWVRTWACEAELCPSGVANIQHWTGIYTKLIETLPTNQFRMFAAREPTSIESSSLAAVATDYKSSTKMIGTGYVHLFSGVASIHCIAVIPAHRSKGLGSALTRYAMGLGKDMGYQTAMLTASMSSSSSFSSSYGSKAAMFSPLGFKEFGRVKLYAFRPLLKTGTELTNEPDKIREAEDDGWEWVGEEEDEDDC
ncbi:GNAT family N-acetyltransferase [Microdochium nivale]|nr:GNAT family N-acetyltransferase [Microdochium nivale]